MNAIVHELQIVLLIPYYFVESKIYRIQSIAIIIAIDCIFLPKFHNVYSKIKNIANNMKKMWIVEKKYIVSLDFIQSFC